MAALGSDGTKADLAPVLARRVLWYWPFARTEEMALAAAFADHQDLALTVQVIDREAAPPAGHFGNAMVTRSLPDINRSARGGLWAFSRLSTYAQRARHRRGAIRGLQPDLVHYHYVNRFTDSLRRPATTWILSVHDIEPHTPRLGRFERPLLRRLYKRPDGLIVHHPWLADRLHADYGVDRSKIAVVPHQVFPVANPAPRPSEGRPMVLSFGALRPNKGITALIDLMTDERLAGLDLHIAGRGDTLFEREVVRRAERVANVTTELGFISTERKAELFRQASVVAMPYESFSSQSGVLHDAYGHGRPVVVTDVGALGETVRHDGTGRVVAVGDRDALAEALVAMTSDDGDAPAHAARAVAQAQTPARIAEVLRAAYDRFMD